MKKAAADKDKPMTIGQLHKLLEGLIQKHGPRLQVCVSIPTLWTGNDTFNVSDIHKGDVQCMNMCDGDGFTIINKDGSERVRSSFILKGRWWDECPTHEERQASESASATSQS